ncbi:MAG: hypothetical protein AAGA56_13455 [Myxococcota bacterium]
MVALPTAALAGKNKANGKECFRNSDCASNRCKQVTYFRFGKRGQSEWTYSYCTAPNRRCPAKDTPGKNPGGILNIRGTDYRCMDSGVYHRKNITANNGQSCELPNENGDKLCTAGTCKKASDGQTKICAPSQRCAKAGARTGAAPGTKERGHTCSGGLWRKSNGLECRFDNTCLSGKCAPTPNRNKKYCLAPNRDCGYPWSAGKKHGDEWNLGEGRRFKCYRGDIGWRKVAGQPCSSKCAPFAKCQPGPRPNTFRGPIERFCAPIGRCSLKNAKTGVERNRTRAYLGKLFRCNANGTWTQLN